MRGLAARQAVEDPSLQGELTVHSHVIAKIKARAIERPLDGAHGVLAAAPSAHEVDRKSQRDLRGAMRRLELGDRGHLNAPFC
jgi:hypothetical protein